MLAFGKKPIKFTLKKEFKEELSNLPVVWGFGGLSEFTYYRTYARKMDNGKLEKWSDCVIRVIEGMFSIMKTHAIVSHMPWQENKAHRLAQEAATRLFEFKWTPPGRGLWMMGTDYMWERGGMSLYNCSFVSTDNIEIEMSKPFAFAMDVLMCGVGVGYDTLGAEKIMIFEPEGEPEVIVVDDTREGWVEAISCLLDSYFEDESKSVIIDTQNIRPYGEPIKGFGGVASGPDPLCQGFNGIKDILNKRSGNFMTASDIVDVMDIIGKIVVAGNVRRSALLALGTATKEYLELKDWNINPIAMGVTAPNELKELSKSDYDSFNNNLDKRADIIKKYKNKNWAYKFNGWRWSSNNSIYGELNMDYSKIASYIAINGEPGIFWLDNARSYGRMKDGIKNDDLDVMGVNPCSEIPLSHMETCNLNENYIAKHDDYWDFQRTLKFSYLYSKVVTLLATNWPETNAIIAKNRRIGCSVSGIQEAFIKFGRSTTLEWLDRAYTYIDYIDKKYSDWLGIPLSIRKTCIKPSGTVSLLAGSLPGIHHPESTSYYRTIRIASNSDLIPILKQANYRIEPAASDPEKTSVVYFPILHDEKHISKKEVSIWRQFKDTADLQKYFCDNMVSVTVTFNKDEANQIAECLSAFEKELKSISLLPLSEHGYIQAPYIDTPRGEIISYKESLFPLDFSSVAEEDSYAIEANRFCSNDGCEI